MKLYGLTCEHMENPIGIDVEKPRFSWKYSTEKNDSMQASYRITIATDEDFSDVVWDTKTVKSDKSLLVKYDGKPLCSCTKYYFKVEVCDNHGDSDIAVASFETAFMSKGQWQAKYICAPEQTEHLQTFYKAINVDKKVKSARLYATSLGIYEAYLNGKRIGDLRFTPGFTSYNNRLQYQTYDITDLLVEGDNIIEATVANGWYKGPLAYQDNINIFGDTRAFLGQITVCYEDGTTDTIVTDSSWKIAQSPILMSELYNGETYDARMEKKLTANDLESLPNANEYEHTFDTLEAQNTVPVKEIEVVTAKEYIETPKGEKIIDFGQNLTGYVRFKVRGKAGEKVVIRHAEILDKDGNFYTENYRTAVSIIDYTLRGDWQECYNPHLSFQGFRYIRLDEYPGEICLENFEAVVVHSDMKKTGTFKCSDDMVNQLQSNILWGQKGNFLDLPTDCPQRDERLGWTGDAQVFVPTACFNMDVASFFTKWLKDMKAESSRERGVPHVVPHVLHDGAYAATGWSDAAVICPWTIYVRYADVGILEENYSLMQDWVEYMKAQGDDPYLYNTGFQYGDWLALERPDWLSFGMTPTDLIATAYFAYSTQILYKTAKILGKNADYANYKKLYKKIVKRFHEEFVTSTNRLAGGTQTTYILPMQLGIIGGKIKERAINDLLKTFSDGVYLRTGFLGTPYFCSALSENGHIDMAYKLFLRKEFPSWLYPVSKGATTIWERWEGIQVDGTPGPAHMNSYNHYAYGAVGNWMYSNICGIKCDEEKPGYKHIVFAPQVGEELEYATAGLESPYGAIVSSWEKQGDTVKYVFTVPANTTATICIGGKRIEKGSGTYEFVEPCKK